MSMTDAMALLFPHVATTGSISVRVAVSFLPEQSAPALGRWFWSYHVRIENGGSEAVQLLERSWKIIDGEGRLFEVRGEGVVGETPLIRPGESFDYVSGCPLETSSGEMSGNYHLVSETGAVLEVEIPAFELIGPGPSAA
jgi:ApaG protein